MIPLIGGTKQAVKIIKMNNDKGTMDLNTTTTAIKLLDDFNITGTPSPAVSSSPPPSASPGIPRVQPLDWTQRLLYLSIVAAILLLGAIVIYIICYLTGSDSDDDDGADDNTNKDDLGDRNFAKIPSEKAARGNNTGVWAAGRQTMVSSLCQSASDKDVVLATAMSSIPLKELGGRENDIIVDVRQKLIFNDDSEEEDRNGAAHSNSAKKQRGRRRGGGGGGEREEKECIVCKDHRVTWKQLSCFAQTTISVLVCKNILTDDRADQSSGNINDVADNKQLANDRKDHEKPIARSTKKGDKEETSKGTDLQTDKETDLKRTVSNKTLASDSPLNKVSLERQSAVAVSPSKEGTQLK